LCATKREKMNIQKTIKIEEFRKVVKELADETKNEFPNLYFDYAGMIPIKDDKFRYDSSPINTEVFATTGGDGVHYSILEISESIQPIVMTVPMNFGDSMKDYNWIIGENLDEFLSIGFYNGWFPIEQLCYDNEWVINFYSKENMEDDFQKDADFQFVKKLREKIGYHHIPLNNQRLKELEINYFDQLKFNKEFVEKYIKRRN
jgi:hypothetical protein